jgi:hypothetical protein
MEVLSVNFILIYFDLNYSRHHAETKPATRDIDSLVIFLYADLTDTNY